MKLPGSVVVALVAAFFSLATSALGQQDVVFDNTDGTFTATSASSGDLSLNGSTLFGVSGFANNLAGYNYVDSDIGTVNFTTGNLESTTSCTTAAVPVCTAVTATMVPLSTEITSGTTTTITSSETSNFSAGGNFVVHDDYNGGFGDLVFKGTFQSASWSCASGAYCHVIPQGATDAGDYKGTWVFNGTLTNVTIKIDGQTISVATGPITIQTTTEKNVVATMSNGQLTFTDSGGTTNFTGNFSVAPEPGSLLLFGSGLVTIGWLTRRRLADQDHS